MFTPHVTAARGMQLAGLISALILFSCTSGPGHSAFDYLGGDFQGEIEQLFLQPEYSSRFVLMENLIRRIADERDGDDLRSFIHQYTVQSPDDPFNGYYLLLLAQYYEEENSLTLSEYYYSRVLSGYPDVQAGESRIHFLAIQGLLRRINDPARRIELFERLLEDFPDSIEPGITWYRLAQEYKQDGRHDDYYQALQQFLNYPDTRVPGMTDAAQQVRAELAFHRNSRKDWTSPDLTTLVNNIRYALSIKNATLLERYRAKENFFSMSWLQDAGDVNARYDFNIAVFLNRPGRISSSIELTNVNESEAYLKTSNWSYRIPHWYFYFRKIDYPADPEIHGNWEWAGIYFGDTL